MIFAFGGHCGGPMDEEEGIEEEKVCQNVFKMSHRKVT